MASTISTSSKRPAENPLPATTECRHCQLPFRPTESRPDFCCSGCQFVFNLINKKGLEKYYDLQDGKGQPVKAAVFQPHDFSWLAELVSTAETKSQTPSLVLDLQGISCVGCVWLIEEVFQRREGSLSIQINSSLGQLRLQWTKGVFDLPAFAADLQSFGYTLAPATKHETNRESRLLVRRIGLAAAFFMNCMLFTVPFYFGMDDDFEYAPQFRFMVFFFATASLLVGGSYFIRRSWEALRKGIIHIDLPISLGILVAYAGSIYAWLQNHDSFFYFDFVSTFIFLMLVGRWTQQLAIDKNRNYLLGLRNRQQQIRLLDSDGNETSAKTDISELAPGMRYVVAPGQFVPVASELLSPNATFGLEWINGESDAHHCRRGNSVLAGAINIGGGDIHLQARESWSESLLASLLTSQPKDAPRNFLLEKIIKVYLCAVILIATAGGAIWYSQTGNPVPALQVFISVLVVSCPCAIGIAWPLADEMAVSFLRQRGVFVRDQSLWHRLGKIRKIVFDKTGTLTMENLALLNPGVFHKLTAEARGVLLHLVESNLHPVSRCLREYLLAEGFDQKPSELNDLPVREIVGFGVEIETETGTWRLGRPGWKTASCAENPVANFDCQFTLNHQTVATFSLGEEIRPDAAEEVRTLASRDYEIYILSGDRPEKVRAMAAQLDLPPENCLAQMTPDGKAEWIDKTDRQDTMMIGDGANDSLAFDRAWCRGTPAVDRGILEEKADFYFLGRGLNGIRNLFETSVNRRKTLQRVFGFTICYNIVVVALSLAGLMNPIVAAIVMPISSLISIGIVAIQSKLLNRYNEVSWTKSA